MTPETILSSSALMTNVNNPRLSRLIGRVSRIRTGRKKAFRIPSKAAAERAERNPSTRIPAIRYGAAIIDTVSISHRTIIPFIETSSEWRQSHLQLQNNIGELSTTTHKQVFQEQPGSSFRVTLDCKICRESFFLSRLHAAFPPQAPPRKHLHQARCEPEYDPLNI
jgi:hypothetical protein